MVQWARKYPSQKLAGHGNIGWPGCCRAPNAGENHLIPPADWPAVSIVHQIPSPVDVKALLDSIGASPPPRKGSPGPTIVATKVSSPPAFSMQLDRRNSTTATPSRAAPTISRTQPLSIPNKGRSAGSPKETAASLMSTTPRASGMKENIPGSNTSPLDSGHSYRRQTTGEQTEKRGDSPNTPSPLRRNIDLESTISRRSSERRPSVSAIRVTSTKALADSPPLRRRASTDDTASFTSQPSLSSGRSVDRQNTISTSRPSTKRSTLDVDFAAMSVSGSPSPSSASSETRSRSGSEGTVTSDGGFTDYLSDESEAEIQRQAEMKAALLAQNHMEEQEFRAARQQLAHVDLRPPKSWNPTNTATPRSQGASTASQAYGSIPAIGYASQTRGQVDAVGIGRSR